MVHWRCSNNNNNIEKNYNKERISFIPMIMKIQVLIASLTMEIRENMLLNEITTHLKISKKRTAKERVPDKLS